MLPRTDDDGTCLIKPFGANKCGAWAFRLLLLLLVGNVQEESVDPTAMLLMVHWLLMYDSNERAERRMACRIVDWAACFWEPNSFWMGNIGYLRFGLRPEQSK